MPGHKTHRLCAFFSYLLLRIAYSWHIIGSSESLFSLQTSVALVCAALGGLFPDIDIKSKGQYLWYVLLSGASAYTWYSEMPEYYPVLLILALVPPLLPHRGLTHDTSVLTALSLAGLSYIYATQGEDQQYFFLALELVGAFWWGAFTHIVLDFFPWPRFKFFRAK